MELAAALRNRPPAIVASSRFSARCANQDALLAMYEDTCGAVPTDTPWWLLVGKLRRMLGTELPGLLEQQQHLDEADALSRITAMPIDLVLTTSMSHGWEEAFAKQDKIVQSIAPGESPDYDYDAIVYHLWGRTSAPATLSLTVPDLERVRRETGVQALLQSWWSSRVFVFVGFDLLDGELQKFLELMLPPQESGQHFAFIPGLSTAARDELQEQFGITAISEGDTTETLCNYLEAAKQTTRETADLDALVARATEDANDPAVARGFELLEHRLRQDGSYERLVDVHLARLSVATEAEDRQQILLETASLLEHKMLDLERSFHANLAAYRELPSKEFWPRLRRRAVNQECIELMAAVLVELRHELRLSARLPALLLAVELYREVGNTTGAIEAVELATTSTDSDEQVAALHRSLLEEGERWYELTRALERATARADFNEEREKHLLAHAVILEDRLDQSWAAIECYQQALAINPSSEQALEALERLFLHLHQVPALLDLLFDYGSRYSETELHTKMWRLGEQCRSRGDHTGAVLCFDKLRDDNPSDEKLLEVLTELYAQLGETSSLVDILKAQVGTAKAGAERAELCQQLAQAHEKLSNWDEAAEYWEWVSHDLPGSELAVKALERLYRKSQSGQSLLALYSRQRELASGQDKSKWILLLADVYQHQLSDPGPAIDLLSDLYKQQPNNGDLGARILILLKQDHRHGEAARLCDQLASQVEGQKQATLREHAARLWQQDGRMHHAIKSLEAGIKVLPSSAKLHKELAAVLQLEGENLRAAEVYDRASELSTGPESTKYALKAAYCFEKLDATDRGIKVLEHRWHSGSEESVIAMELRRLYQARGRHADLIKLLEKQSGEVKSEEYVEQLLAMADAHAALGQSSEEIASLQKALSLVAHPEVARRLAEVALKHNDYGVAAEASEALLAYKVSPEEEAEAYCLLARRSNAMGNQKEAMTFLAKARDRAPFSRGALNLLVEFSSEQPKGQVSYLQALLLDAPDQERADILVKIGDICKDKLGEQTEAREAYQDALLITPDDHLLLHRCLAIAIDEQKWDESLEYLEHLIKTEDEVSVRARYRSTMAHLFEEELGDIDVAIDLLWQASREAPDNQIILRRLAVNLRSKEDWQGLLDCSSRLLAALREDPAVTPVEHANAWIDLADLCSEHLGDRATAICALEVVIGLQPDSIDHRERLAQLYQEDQRFDDAIAQHQAILDLEPSLLPSYTAMVRLYESAGNSTAAQACAQAVSTMCGEASKHIPIPPRKTKVMSRDDLARLRHNDDRFALGRLLALLTPAIASLTPPKRRRGAFSGRKVLASGHPMTVKIAELAKQLGVHTPLVYRQQESGIKASVERTGDKLLPVITVGQELLDTASAIKTTHHLCQVLVKLRREYLAQIVQPQGESLGHVLDAVFELVAEEGGARVSKTATAVNEVLDRESFDRIKLLVSKLRPDMKSGQELVGRWVRASEMSAARVALWVVGDLLAALEVVEGRATAGRAYEEQRQDLIRAFCSDRIRSDMKPKPSQPLTMTPMEATKTGQALGKSMSLRQNFRNIARSVTEEIRLDSL